MTDRFPHCGAAHVCATLVVLAGCARGPVPATGPAPATHVPSIVPLPAEVVTGRGTFVLTAATPLQLTGGPDSVLRPLADVVGGLIAGDLGTRLPAAVVTSPSPGAIVLRLAQEGFDAGDEQYRLDVTDRGMVVAAPSPAGLFHGVQTLRQLLPVELAPGGPWRVAAVHIADRPRFGWRGMHLDVGRHFYPVAFIKRYLDVMAAYKLNVFHWHLTDDQGWRLEIRRYPRLTSVGGCRGETMVAKNFDPYVGDGTRYCGWYTQDEVREVVAYARQRFITVVPEIEMPGHALAALAAHPELACTPGPFAVATTWGVFDDVFCPTETTVAFLEDVLREVLTLFPSRYIHVGGDEVPKRRWRESAAAQDVMRREGLRTEEELQSWFIRRIERFLRANGRRLVGWDEIIEGGLAPEATVMSWRGTAGGLEAARQGHDVVMSPTSHAYFDYYQGDPRFEPLQIGGMVPLERVYGFEPVPGELSAEQARHVLGAQGNVWTEYLPTEALVEHAALPRMLAMAEVVWTPRARRSWSDFAARLPRQFARLDRWGLRYRIPPVTGLERDQLTLADRVTVTLGQPVVGGEVRYTTDGTVPTPASPRYERPLDLAIGPQGAAVAAAVFRPDGRSSPLAAARFTRAVLREAARVDTASLVPGVRWSYVEDSLRTVDSLARRSPVRAGVAERIGLTGAERPEYFGLEFTGFVRVPADGIYEFQLTSDDGSRLWIGDQLVVDHDGLHGAEPRGGQVALRAGHHALRVRYFQAGGGKSLAVTVARAGQPAADVTPWLRRPR
jgi:hexosaminidase